MFASVVNRGTKRPRELDNNHFDFNSNQRWQEEDSREAKRPPSFPEEDQIITVISGDERFYCARSLMTSKSEMFAQTLQGSNCVVRLPNVEGIMEPLKTYFHTGHAKVSSLGMADDLLRLAKMYLMKDLEEQVCQQLFGHGCSDALEVLRVATAAELKFVWLAGVAAVARREGTTEEEAERSVREAMLGWVTVNITDME